MIDYAVCSYDIFPLINDFIVHDMYVYSSHLPIQLCLGIKRTVNDVHTHVNKQRVDILTWQTDRIPEYKNNMLNNVPYIEKNVNYIVVCNKDISEGVDLISQCLYNTAYTTFGKTFTKTNQRKFCNPWFDKECEKARQEFRSAKRAFKHVKSVETRSLLLSKRKIYKSSIRKARARYTIRQKSQLHKYANESPQKFWAEIKKA